MRGGAAGAVALCAISLCLGWAGASRLRDEPMPGVQPTFPGTSFAPAVCIAAGEGFRRTDPSSAPEVETFLRGELSALPDHALDNARYIVPITQDRRHYYLECLVGLTWKCFGIRWRALLWPVMLMYLALGGIVYGLFRFWANRWIASACTLLALWSPGILTLLPQLRDFGRAVFILGPLLIAAHLIRAPVKGWRWWGAACVLGVFAGVGYGFREDTVIAIPPVLAAFAFLAPLEGRWKAARRAGAAIFFTGAFLLAASPTLTGREAPGSTMWHYALLGLPTCEMDEIGFGASAYEWISCENDSYLADMADRTRRRFTENAEPPGWMLSEAEARGSERYLLSLAYYFPADLCARGLSAMLHVLGMGAGLPGWIAPFGACWMLLALGLLVWRNPAIAWKAAGIGLYLLGISLIHPDYRHTFYLYIVPVAGLAYVAQCAVEAVARRMEDEENQPQRTHRTNRQRKTVFCLLAALGLVCCGGFGAARLWQARQWDTLLNRYKNAAVAPLSFERIEESECVHFRLRGFGTDYLEDTHVAWDYLAVDLELPESDMYVQLRYGAETGLDAPYTHIVRAERGRDGSSKVRLFFPVFQCAEDREWSNFEGIGLEANNAEAFKGAYRVINHRDFPMLLVFSLPEHPESARLRKTVAWKAASPNIEEPLYIGTPPQQRGWPSEGLEGDPLRAWSQAWLERDPDAYSPWMLLGRASEDLRDIEAARAAYRGAIHATPDFPVAYERLDRLLDNEKRIEGWTGMCAERNAHALPWLYLGRALAAAGHWPRAADAFSKSLRIAPASLRAMKGLAHALAAADLPESEYAARKETALAAAIAENPHNAAAFARCFAPGEETPAKSGAFPPPPSVASEKAAAAFMALANEGQCEKAVFQCEEAIILAPEDFTLARRADTVFRQCLGLDGATVKWRELSRALPLRAHALFFEGIGFLDSERYREAHACFYEALEEMPAAAYTRGFLGIAQLGLGQCAAALESLERALREAPGATEFEKPLEEAKACAN